MLNEQKGNMYKFVTHTWNIIKGKCPHNCEYCYMKAWGEQPDLHFDERELKRDLGKKRFIFVGSSCDVWASDILMNWKNKMMDHIQKYPGNKYLFQTKNPWCYLGWQFKDDDILGTTIETNRIYKEMGNTLSPEDRSNAMRTMSVSYRTMVTVEPIMDFDLEEFVTLIDRCDPLFINIGANSRHGAVPLKEPSELKIYELIKSLRELGYKVNLKDNLSRIYTMMDDPDEGIKERENE